jgi:hypothetical protein
MQIFLIQIVCHLSKLRRDRFDRMQLPGKSESGEDSFQLGGSDRSRLQLHC